MSFHGAVFAMKMPQCAVWDVTMIYIAIGVLSKNLYIFFLVQQDSII